MRTIVPINAVLQEVSTSENAASVRELRNERVGANFFSRLGAVQARSFEQRTRTSREFSKENSKLNETRCFSGSFKASNTAYTGEFNLQVIRRQGEPARLTRGVNRTNRTNRTPASLARLLKSEQRYALEFDVRILKIRRTQICAVA